MALLCVTNDTHVSQQTSCASKERGCPELPKGWLLDKPLYETQNIQHQILTKEEMYNLGTLPQRSQNFGKHCLYSHKHLPLSQNGRGSAVAVYLAQPSAWGKMTRCTKRT